jgi:hypothetical protein
MRLFRMAATIRGRMTPEMLKITHVTESPLYVPRKKGETEPSVNRSCDNLYIKGITRRGLLAHLKLIVICQPLSYHLIDDAFLLEVYLGKQQYTNRPKELRETLRTYNSINDLIGSEFDLVIITVGIQSYKNVSSPSQLLEALKRRRDVYDRATWILEPPGSNWHLSRDSDVDQYLKDHFEMIELESELCDPEEEALIEFEDITPSLNDYEEVTQKPKKASKKASPRRIVIEATPNLADFDDLSEGNMSKPKYYKGGRY